MRVSVDYQILRSGLPLGVSLQAVQPATVTYTGDAEIKMTLTGTFEEIPQGVDIARDQVQPYLILDGVRRPVGRYAMVTPQRARAGRERSVSLTCYDVSYLAKRAKIEERPYYPAGTRYTAILEEQLIASNILQYYIEPSEEVLQTDREDWEPGTDRLTIINGLAAEINYRSLYVGLDGVARCVPYQTASAGNIRHRYRADRKSVLLPDLTLMEDTFDKPNVFIATVENPEYAGTWRAESVNNDPASPLNVARWGRNPVFYTLDNISSQAELQAYVDNERGKNLIAEREIQYSVGFDPEGLDPLHEPYDVTELSFDDIYAVMEEITHSLTLDAAGEYQITARQVIYHDDQILSAAGGVARRPSLAARVRRGGGGI